MKNYLKVFCVELHIYNPSTEGFHPCYQYITAYNISDAWKCIKATWPQYYAAYMRGEFVIYLKQI